MTSESNRLSGASTAYISTVCAAWGCTWQATSQEGDDGIDGIIYIRQREVNSEKPADKRHWKHTFTGGFIHVQVKSGTSYVKSENHAELQLAFVNLAEKREYWARLKIPCAIIYVAPATSGKAPSHAWWANLHLSDTYVGERIKVLKTNRFETGDECKRPFAKLAQQLVQEASLQAIDLRKTGGANVLPVRLPALSSKPLKWEAWNFFRQWKTRGATHSALGNVIINRTAWSHITRSSRPVERVKQSLTLLPVAARIIQEIPNWRILSRVKSAKSELKDGKKSIIEFIGVSARVHWTERAPSEVLVVLRRQTIFPADFENTSRDATSPQPQVQVWFYTVYEPGRGRKTM